MSSLLKSPARSGLFLVVLLLLLTNLLTNCTTNAPAVNTPTLIPVPTPLLAPPRAQVPLFSHVYLIVMENQEYNAIVGNPNLPYLNSLIARYALATNYHAIAHPSQPNYIALFSGSTQGVQDDDVHNLDAPNLADQLEATGKSWRLYAQNVRSGCFTSDGSSNHAEGPGLYVRTHNPAISFNSISGSASRCANIQGLSQFDPAAADYEFIAPDACNDMHDCSAATGDQFLAGFVPKILNSSAWQQGGVLFIVWDEGTSNQGGGGHIPLLVISNLVPRGYQSSLEHDHYSLLRTIEDAWALPCLEQACSANNLGEFFP
jgi:hypothetical protein